MLGDEKIYDNFARDLHDALWRRHWRRFRVFMTIFILSLVAIVLISEARWYFSDDREPLSIQDLILAAGVN